MSYQFKNGATARLLAEGEPTIEIRNVPWQPGIATYYASQWLDAAAKGQTFTIAGQWHDQPDMDVSVAEVRKVAKWIRKSIPAGVGSFQTAFVADDPRVPF